MKKLALLLLFAMACRTTTRTDPAPAAGGTGTESPRGAVEAFLRAVRNEDLQAMGAIWGTTEGPARDLMSREELERREIVMMCFFRHDSSRILGETLVAGDQRRLTVELTRGAERRTTHFVTVPARGGRWYVMDAQTEPVRDWCSRRQ